MLTARIEFDPEALRSYRQHIRLLPSMTALYNEAEKVSGVKYTGYALSFLTDLTRHLICHWNDDELFILWARMYETTWSETLPRILRERRDFTGVEERYQNDPRSQYVR